MSITAELRPPLLSYNIGGIIFEQGERVPVSPELARQLATNPKFLVAGLDDATVKAGAVAFPPHGEAQSRAIGEAAESRDVEGEGKIDRNRERSRHVIAEKHGHDITVEDLARTIGESGKPVQAQLEADSAEHTAAVSATRSNITIKRGGKSGPPATPAPGALAAEPKLIEPAEDPTTQGAVTV